MTGPERSHPFTLVISVPLQPKEGRTERPGARHGAEGGEGGRWGSGARPGEFQEAEASTPPLLQGSQLPAASATFLPLGGQGMGAQRIPGQIGEAGKAVYLSLLRVSNLSFLG